MSSSGNKTDIMTPNSRDEESIKTLWQRAICNIGVKSTGIA